jgi:outer membrane protein OmpA-like peptidoglycan-associated protein
MMSRLFMWMLAGLLCGAGPAAGQQVEKDVGVVSEETASQLQAFSYREGPISTLRFRGTAIALAAEGNGQVEFQDGRSRVQVSVRKLPQPSTLGPYETYVLWAVTIDGRTLNLGSIDLAGGRGTLKTSAPLSQFALIVTAEPHFAVSAPSRGIVLVNLADSIRGEMTMIAGLAERMDYKALQRQAIDPRARTPSDLYQARYAVQIAELAGASEFAAERFAKARSLLAAAETAQASKKYRERESAPRVAREAVQAAEDARRDGVEARAVAEAQARREAAAAAAAEAARLAAEEQARRQAELVLEESQRQAELAAREAAEQAAAAEAAKARAEFAARLNRALPTRVTDRGVVAEISGVQFATGAATLNPEAREALARFSGIVGTYPELRFKIEGHTDTTGSVETNRNLSLQRAITVRDYLVGQGGDPSAFEVEGLGPDQPVADNATAEGRARNRRVEIVLTGGPVGY